RRNRTQVMAGCLLFLALLIGLAGTTWGLFNADRARRAEAEQRKIADSEREKAEQSAQQAQKSAQQAKKQRACARAEEKEAKKQRKRANDEAEVARQNLYYAQMHLAVQAWREHRGLQHMRELLAKWLPRGKAPDRRGWEWFYLNSLPYRNVRTL